MTSRSHSFSDRKRSMSAISCLGQLHLVGAGLDPESVETRNPLAIEHRVHGDDAFHLAADGSQITLFEHA